MISRKVAEFGSKLASYCCILCGFVIAITLWRRDFWTFIINLFGIACSISGCFWLSRLRRKYD
jgi:hypothetical protein